MAGNASIVGSNQFAQTDYYTLTSVFEQYETNPAISQRTRGLSFHATICPDESDDISQDHCIDFIHDLMGRIGYGEQPYVIYRHNDIDREHYHVISVKADVSGKIIDTSFIGRRFVNQARELEEKFGIKVGKIEQGEQEEKTGQTYKVGGPVREGIKNSIEKALSYQFYSKHQFFCILRSLNVEARLVEGQSNTVLLARGLDSHGQQTSAYYNVEKEFGYDAATIIERTLKANQSSMRALDEGDVDVRTIVEYCLSHSPNEASFIKMMRQMGIDALIGKKRNGEIKQVTFVSHQLKRAVNTETIGTPLSLYQVKDWSDSVLGDLPVGLTEEQKRELSGHLRADKKSNNQNNTTTQIKL